MKHWTLPTKFAVSAFLMFNLDGVAHADTLAPLPSPVGEVVLRISGDLGVQNAPGEAVFDLAMLRALGEVTIRTTTLWTDGVQVFEGVPLRAVLDRVGAKGGVIEAQALNDYQVDIPVTDAQSDRPILAYAQNGVPLTVRDMGPLWMIYPYDADIAYQSETIYARSIWQLQRLILRP